MTTLECLPATAHEIAALCKCTRKQAEARLYYLERTGRARRTKRLVPNGTTGTGAKRGPIWELVKA